MEPIWAASKELISIARRWPKPSVRARRRGTPTSAPPPPTRARPSTPATASAKGRGTTLNGVLVAESVDDLHSDNNKLGKETSLTETGDVVNGRGDDPNMHDILTGSQLDGTAFDGEDDTTCSNWTSSGEEGSAQVGHHDRTRRRRQPDLLALGARLARVQPGQPARHRRQRPLLLLRHQQLGRHGHKPSTAGPRPTLPRATLVDPPLAEQMRGRASWETTDARPLIYSLLCGRPPQRPSTGCPYSALPGPASRSRCCGSGRRNLRLAA